MLANSANGMRGGMEIPFHIFLKSMEQKTITYEEFFTPDFLSLLFYLIVF